MSSAYTDEFNINASSAEVRRKQLYHAATGNESVFSSFTPASAEKLETERRRRDENFQSVARMVLASRERIEQFTKTLDRLDQASMQALIENEEKLRVARENLERIRERAFELTQPDGSMMKVYRDENVVRDDGGAEVDAQLIKPEDIPATAPTWSARRGAGEEVKDLMLRNQEIREYREKLDRGRKLVDSGRVSEQELSEFEADLEKMPGDVRAHYQTEAKAAPERRSEAKATFDFENRPTAPFANAAAGAPAAAKPDQAVKPQGPSFSAPAPM